MTLVPLPLQKALTPSSLQHAPMRSISLPDDNRTWVTQWASVTSHRPRCKALTSQSLGMPVYLGCCLQNGAVDKRR